MSAGANEKGVLNDKTIETISNMKGVDAITPMVSEYLVVGIGKKVAQIEIVGVKMDVLEKFNYELADGRMLKNTDKMGILFGNWIPNWFYDPIKQDWGGDPIDVITNKIIITGNYDYGQKTSSSNDSSGGQQVTFKEYEAKGIGLLAETNDDSSYCAYMNIADVEKIAKEVKKARKEITINTGKKSYDRAMIYVGDINNSEKITKTLKEEMGYEVYSPTDWLSQAKETAQLIQGILGGIGGISLLVAALGITNTMIMSIYERTKEIGVMKVIGANLKDIQKMFLLEAALIGFLGGLIGLALSYILSLLMNTVLKDIISIAMGELGMYGSTISIIPWWVAVGSVAFATLIGVAAGYYPAKRAMNLSALESLRNE